MSADPLRPLTAVSTTAIVALASVLVVAGSQQPAAPPRAVGPVPSPRQLAWHELEFYGFVHFTVNTFTDREWGYGDEPETLFDPASLDVRQWVRVARDAGMEALILTAKHHDGFCLWPSRFTEHSVRRSPWKSGAGDLVGDLSRACAEAGLKFGVYLSPWDRNHAEYGRPSYIAYYRNQLRELLTGYGPIFEVWFDGANGGDGYYGGAREARRIDRATYYDWQNTWNIVRELQPDAVIFSDAGPDVRWVGNERGVAFETSWCTIDPRGLYPGYENYAAIAAGSPEGTTWMPPEVDVSIRPGWFYHEAENDHVKTVEHLVRIYEESVGRGANLLLNIPPDRRGLIPETDASRLREFARTIEATYRTDIARLATATSSETRGNLTQFGAGRVNDGDPGTYWATDDDVRAATLELRWPEPVRFDRVVLSEAIALGQRVEAWTVEAESGGRLAPVAGGTTIGRKRIVTFDPVTSARLRVSITMARACPVLSDIGVYLAPGR
ncbi:MAG: alpha-L-fucosidase [Vicinamibacterales bacterium]